MTVNFRCIDICVCVCVCVCVCAHACVRAPPVQDKWMCVGLRVVQVGFDQLGQLCRGQDHWRR